MHELNPRIRNAIYTFLMDFKKDICSISAECDTHECIDYIANNAYIYLRYWYKQRTGSGV